MLKENLKLLISQRSIDQHSKRCTSCYRNSRALMYVPFVVPEHSSALVFLTHCFSAKTLYVRTLTLKGELLSALKYTTIERNSEKVNLATCVWDTSRSH